jgi:NAD(P)-dependent dehydrogenase (short-subunit alcohol dehydrogenase family)
MKKAILIIGSVGGLGSHVSAKLSRDFNIIGVNREGVGKHDNAWYRTDIAEWKEIEFVCSDIVEKGDGIAGIVNCAGENFIKPIPELTEYDLQRLMKVNAFSTFHFVQNLLEQLRGGFVCNVVSNAATIPMTNSLAYNISKAAAKMLSKQMAREL